jgi:hypothetical protein
MQRLATWGVHRVYGYPRDSIDGVFGSQDLPDFSYSAYAKQTKGKSWQENWKA